MGRDRSNKFRSAVRHLKSNRIDEKLELLSEIPTNNMGGVYTIDPEYVVQDPDIPGEVTREADFTQDDSATDTTGLFDDDGTILTIEPPITEDSPDRSYILGPMSSMWYAWGNFTQIGYIAEDTRRMVNLGRITGQLKNWDGVNNFTSYGQLTLEQAVWFRDTPKYLNEYDNYRAFYPGPPSNTPDQYGRYRCTITGTTKSTTVTPQPRRVPPNQGGPEDAGFPWGMIDNFMKGFDGLTKKIKPFTDLLLGVDDSAILDVLQATNDKVILPIFQKLGQATSQAFGIKSGLIMTAALDIRGTVHTARLGGENEIFMRGGDFPVMIKSNNELDYVANLASSLMKSIGTGRMIMIDNSNLSPSIVGSRLTSNDIKTAFSTHKVETKRLPKPLPTDADSILNPSNKKTYFGGKGFGNEGGSILEPYISTKNGVPMLRNTADKFLRVGGESGERYDITTQQFTDVPSLTPKDAKNIVDLASNKGLYEVIRQTTPGNENLTYDEYQKTINKNSGLKTTISNVASVGKGVFDLPVAAKSIGSTTGFVNGSAMGALIYAEVKKIFGGRPVTELDSKGGRGHVRRETHISINDLRPEQQKVFIQQLDAQGIRYNKNWNNVKESREVLTESRKRILRDIKKPYVLPEVKQEKYKFKKLDKVRAKHGRTINSDLMKQAEVPTSFKAPDDRLWGKYEKEKNAKRSQHRKNVVLDHLGGGDHFLEYVYENGKQKNEISYEMFGGKAPKKVVRKEQLKSDILLFLADENGKKESILQSEINNRLDQEFNKELFEKYFEEQQTLQADNDPLFKKISKRLKKEIDYPDKPSKAGYPNDPPPEMVNGFHPELGKKGDYYKKLDPQSASAMPETGEPEIDNNVRYARKKPK